MKCSHPSSVLGKPVTFEVLQTSGDTVIDEAVIIQFYYFIYHV